MSRKNGRHVDEEENGVLNANAQKLDQESRSKYPSLFVLLDPRWKKGKVTYEGGTMSIAPIGGLYKMTVRCPSAHVDYACVVTSLVTAFEEFERQLASGQIIPMPDYDAKKKARQAMPD